MVNVTLHTVSSGYDRKTCWVHARLAVIPGNPATLLITAQKLLLSGDDVFYELNDFRSYNSGESWTGPFPHHESLGRKLLTDGREEAICDFTPGWHEMSHTILGTGINAIYESDVQCKYPPTRSTLYSVFLPGERRWLPRRRISGEIPFIEGAGCTQRVDLANGDILLPTYLRTEKGINHASTVMHCRFDGETLEYLRHGDILSLPESRGFVEPSLATVNGRYFLTLRNDVTGYVTSSEDGLHFLPPKPWCFDDGSDLGSYNTQQHWVTHRDQLYLVYTRRGANNDHIMRHRAPLFIARVDQNRLRVIRESEQIVIPENGARLCNFGVAKVSEDETWVSVAEWMQTTLPDPFDYTICERYGSSNRIFAAKLNFC